ncbi:Electron transport complex protein RnfD [hydrothermal vent metagenome]|uniref:Electron transport complex protein RnfD n=1 Tax=hydrothermal vent metagenome TaxID=652676 RepID=A0A3B0WY38_9ZZZZ
MQFKTASSPHITQQNSVQSIMFKVLLAMVPGTVAMTVFFGWGVLINILLACAVALGCEALMLWLRKRPITPYLTDGSAILTACLLALALPQLAPWWLIFTGTAFAIIIGKHLYGGLGFNPFNPAMVGYVVVIISFPREMTQWVPPLLEEHVLLTFTETLKVIFTGELPLTYSWDAITMATPLDTVKTQLGLELSISEIESSSLYGHMFGAIGGFGWEWVNGLFLASGVYLAIKRIIDWRIPAGIILSLLVLSNSFALYDYASFTPPTFHLFSGGIMLAAFFIATDPVTAATSTRGRWLYGTGIGIFIFIIRTWGAYPDGIAFAILLMNMATPLLDYYTMPRAFGHHWAEFPHHHKDQDDEEHE